MPLEIASIADLAAVESRAISSAHASNGNPKLAVPHLVSATELYAGKVIALRPLLRDVLWDGLTMMIARPKAGKSWLMLQVAIQIAGGRQVAGLHALGHGPVLYAALEEPQARTMSRLRLLAPEGDWSSQLHFVYTLLPLMSGGAEQLSCLIEQVQPRLVVIDTLTAVIGAGGKQSSDVFRSQYAEVSRVRKLAEDHRTAVVLVHHVRKGIADGAIEAVAGTGGIAAAVDSLWYLKRKPESEATLEVIGRETEERTWALKFGTEPVGWSVLGSDVESLLSAERHEILTVLRDDGPMTPAQISAELGKSRPATRKLLQRMREDQQISKQGGKYVAL